MSPSLVYLEEYLDTATALPDAIQSGLSRLADLDAFHHETTTDQLPALIASLTSPSASHREELLECLLRITDVTQEKSIIAREMLATAQRHLLRLEDDVLALQEEVSVSKSTSSFKKAKNANNPADKAASKTCVCGREDAGEMVGCENPDCAIEWFHLHCVGLNKVPVGKWYCRQCQQK